DVAVFAPRADLPAAEADGFDGVFTLQPRADIEVVDVLLDVEITREPGEVVPVAHLPSHVAPLRLPRLDPDRAAIVVGLQILDFADLAVVNPLDRFHKRIAVAKTQSGNDG